MKKKTVKRMLLSTICCGLCIITVALSSPISAYADNTSGETKNTNSAAEEEYKNQLADLQDKQKDIAARQKALNDKIKNAKSEKAQLQAKANSLDEQISITRDQMELCQNRINVTQDYISAKQAEIDKKETDINESMQLFRDRVRAIYMTGGYSDKANSLIMLLSSESVSDFLTRAMYLKRLNEHDRALMDVLEEELASLNDEKAKLDETKKELEAEKAELTETRDSLQNSLIEARSSIQDINAMQSELEENYEELSGYLKEIQNEIADIYKNLTTSKEDYVGGEMMWPAPGYSKITCEYGWRFNGTDFHTGIDISGSGIHGAKVVAANTGTVIFTKQCPYNGYSYGYGTYAIVDHGGGITTLYAHMSSLAVNVGDVVVMGQQIGNVGNTGWSTGAHLHFEVRKDGKSVNPLPYVTG
ncbi:MAG: peptidoglycan DD-metalloendopeptidase family protein [Oscillospiraceae bacterium]|nr:peptidoglycan DD-metalloendopeptidase family protein [Oscillospiraceae bacterium]